MTEETPTATAILAATDGPILLFDGVCSLCNGVVRFVAAHDRRGLVSFAPLDSPVGRTLLAHFDLPTDETDSVVFVERGRAYRKSEAAARLACYLDGPWSLAAGSRVVPRELRDAVYDVIADNRYDVFGRHDADPDPAVRERFLDGAPEDALDDTA